MDQKAVEIENLSIQFHKSTERIDSFKEYLIKIAKRDLSYEKFWALKDVSLSINRGETVGIIGLNGSGKSTLLKVIAGVLKPAEGNVRVNAATTGWTANIWRRWPPGFPWGARSSAAATTGCTAAGRSCAGRESPPGAIRKRDCWRRSIP